jgi:hypothetical protein
MKFDLGFVTIVEIFGFNGGVGWMVYASMGFGF